ncbi:hypothetical protein Tco_0954822 [Tanacetum coccineum]|uniref:Uncharacterized protein n=1 Tax=Tanacetum coccineum TaxID=301880 RepID=A0ABQ5E5G5_9ASTR
MSLGLSTRVAEATTLSDSAFRKRYRSSSETSPSPTASPVLPLGKRYRGTSKLILDTNNEGDDIGDEDGEEEEDKSLDLDDEREGTEDEGPSAEGEGLKLGEDEAAPEGQQQVAPVVDAALGEPLGLGFMALRRLELAEREGELPIIPSPILSPMAYLAIPSPTALAAAAEAESFMIKLGAQVEMQRGLIRDHTERWERAIVTFSALWRLVLALEVWASQTDAQRAALWHAMYDVRRENHELRLRLVEERRKQIELADRVARLERRQESGGE